MELIRISDSKLKIMLTPMDMRQFELSTDNFYDDSEKMHRSFRRLFDNWSFKCALTKCKLGGQEFLIFLKANFLVFFIAPKITQIPKGLATG